MLYPIILSGGLGKRLWPVSSHKNPKQFHKFFNNQTLLQNTYNRILSGFDKNKIFVVANVDSVAYIRKQIKVDNKNIIKEPDIKGTAMAIGMAAVRLLAIDKDANLVIINSDHFIKNEKKYIRLLRQAERLLDGKYQDKFFLAGIKPTYPETGYGYIKLGKKIDQDLYQVDSFKEKPDKKTADDYVKRGFLWNPAIFLFKASRLLEWYKKYLPGTYRALQNIASNSSLDNVKKQYAGLKNISIDYGLLEKMSDMIVLETNVDWADIGNWRSLRDVLYNKQDKNVSNTKTISIDSKKNLFYSSSGKLVASLGLEDTILVETDDVIFLCPADRAQDLKQLLSEIAKKKLDKYL